MKSARDVAIDCLHRTFLGHGFSRETFVLMAKDPEQRGRITKELVEAVEKAIEADRVAQEKQHAPS